MDRLDACDDVEPWGRRGGARVVEKEEHGLTGRREEKR
jgi:hypothetical protein